jgi:stearoyl-CoA desaturase (Delta-9 desaturase)
VFPGSARHGLGRYQVDVSWMLIRGLERLGLVWNVKLPTPERIARRLA